MKRTVLPFASVLWFLLLFGCGLDKESQLLAPANGPEANRSQAVIQPGYYKLLAVHSGKSLCIDSASTSDGANVHQWDYIDDSYYDQQWSIADLGNGYYSIINRNSGKGLDVYEFSTSNGGNIVQWDYWGGDNQQWQINELGDGTYSIISRLSGLAIDVEGLSTDNGANIFQWEYLGGNNQKWQIVAVGSSSGSAGMNYDDYPNDLIIDLTNKYKPVTHMASGSLYGLWDEGRPSDSVIAPTKPFMFVQPAPNGQHAPYSYPSGTGDVLDNAHIAARNGATVTIRMADTFPYFPYHFVSIADWENRVNQMITDWQNSGNSNLYGYEIYNEPDYTYDGQSIISFNELWRLTYNIIRQRDPNAKIIGPSTTSFNSFAVDFLNWTRSNNCLPDIVSWHELGGAWNVQGHIDSYNNMGIGRPVSINEYVASDEDGRPGKINDYISKLERNLIVESACLPFWSTVGSLGNILTSNFQPNGAYWVLKWYGDMNGSMVWAEPPAVNIDGFASINNSGNRVDIVFGGYENQRIVIYGFSQTSLGTNVYVNAEYTEWVGINTVYNNPGSWFSGNYNVSNDILILEVNNLNEFSSHRITITPAN